MYSTKFVQKLAFAYRTCPLSLETTKHFQAYINSVLWSGIYANSNNVATLKRQPTKVADKMADVGFVVTARIRLWSEPVEVADSWKYPLGDSAAYWLTLLAI